MLDKLFASKVRIKLLDRFLSTPDSQYYIRELERLTKEDYKNINRELKNLEDIGLLKSKKEGNIKYYFADKDFLLYPELKSIVLKTTGVEGTLKRALNRVKNIKYAFIYGSYAKGEETTQSDIDLMIIGEAKTESIIKPLRAAERKLGRTISYSIFEPSEIRKRLKKKSDFIIEVFGDRKIMIVGEENELFKLGE